MLFHKPVRWWFPNPIFPNAHELRAHSHTFKIYHGYHWCDGFYLFTDFFYSWIFIGFHCAWRRGIASSEGNIRQNPCALAHIIRDDKIKIRERTDPSHPLSIRDSLLTLVVVAKRGAHDDMSGTIFQTAIYTSVVIPRLRPGLLSLRSV